MTTFVTSFLNLGNNESTNISFCIEKFMEIVNTGIQICVYVDNSLVDILKEAIINNNNVKIMKIVVLSDTLVYKFCQEVNILQLPYTDNNEKDTIDYLIFTNSKIEFMYDAIIQNVYKTCCNALSLQRT